MRDHDRRGEALSRRALLRGGAGVGAAVVAAPLLAACEPTPSDRDAWQQSFTTPGSLDVTVAAAGAWCWFSEARTLITPAGRLYVGSVVGGTGTAQDGSIEITSLDVSRGLRADAARRSVTLERAARPRAIVGQHDADDHNNPGLEVTSSGAVIGMWSGHGQETLLRRCIDRSGDGTFEVQEPLDRPDSVTFPGRGVSYGTVHRLRSGTLMAAYRGEGYSWNLLRSTDGGETWDPLGLIVVPPYAGERPYVKLAVDGDRLWLATTEGHPNSYQPTNIRVATIDADGTIRHPDGRRLGACGPGVPVLSLPYAYRCPANADAWISEIRVIAGRVVLSVSLRGPRVDDASGEWSHDHLRVMLDPGSTTWVRELVARGGGQLGNYPREPNYSGLAALDPTQHNRVVVATNVHPLTGVALRSRADGRVHFELWEMNRGYDGRWSATWLTRDSPEDNIRPHIAVAGRTKILSWMRGRYPHPLAFATRIVSRQAA